MLKPNPNSTELLNTLPTLIDSQTAEDIRRRDSAIRDWMTEHKTNSYRTEELSKELGFVLPTNDERSNLEVFEFVKNPPERYFLYIKAQGTVPVSIGPRDTRYKGDTSQGATGEATTWTGQRLGRVTFGRAYRSAFGDVRVPIWIDAVNGLTYYGTYYKSAGDYARVKATKQK